MKSLGRFILGDEVPLGVQCVNGSGVPSAPTSAPTMQIYTSAGTAVLSKQIPPQDQYSATGWFGYKQALNSSFATGRYYVRYEYDVGGTTYAGEVDAFEIVDGGSTDGQILSMFFLDRPDGNDYMLVQTDQGTLGVNRGPKVV